MARELICPACSGRTFRQSRILWPALIDEWGLSPAEVDLIDRQQGLHCATCGSNLRSMSIAAAFLREYASPLNFNDFVQQSEQALNSRLLELNTAGSLTRWLSQFRSYAFGQYPQVDMQNLPVEDDAFDIVVHSDTLEHIADPVRALSECRRVLRPGGKLFFTIPIVPSRLTRRRTGLPPSYHGTADQSAGDFLVHTEYGSDFFVDPVAAGFTSICMHTLGDLSSFCLVCTRDRVSA